MRRHKARTVFLSLTFSGLALAGAALIAARWPELSPVQWPVRPSERPETATAPAGETSMEDLAGPSIDELMSSSVVLRPSAQGVSSKVAPPKSVAVFSRLHALRSCERSLGENCAGLSTKRLSEVAQTPSGLMNALADQTASELVRLKLKAESEMGLGQPLSFSVSDVASAYVKHPDDLVRERALDLVELVVFLEPRAALNVASQAILTTVSGPLVEKALGVLEATRTSDPSLVDQVLLKALGHGGWDVRDRIARGILPFLNSENRDTYARALSTVPARSKQALYLRLNLEEFDRMERL